MIIDCDKNTKINKLHFLNYFKYKNKFVYVYMILFFDIFFHVITILID